MSKAVVSGQCPVVSSREAQEQAKACAPQQQPSLPGIGVAVAPRLPKLPVRAVEIAPILCGHRDELVLVDPLRPGRYLLCAGRRVLGEVTVGAPWPVEALIANAGFNRHSLSDPKTYDDEVFLR